MGNMKNDFTLNRADSALLARDFSLAARLYRSILAKDPTNKEVMLKLGSTYVKAGQDGKAEGAYVGVLRIDPVNFEALDSLGGVFRRLGKYKESIKVLERALKINNSSQVKYNMGFTYKLMEEYDSAAECFTAVIEDNPNDVLAYNHLGAIQARRGEHRKALQTYMKGLQIDQNHPILHYNSAVSYLALGDYAEARNSYDNALRARPGWPDAMNGLAELFIQEGQYPDAQDLLSQGLKINPENSSIQVTQGRLYVKRGNYTDAEAVYRSVLEKKPDDYSVMGRLEKVYEKTDKFDEAYAMLERMKKKAGSEKDISKRNIQLLINQGKLKDAGELLNKERKEAPDDPEILNLLSQYFVRAGKIDKAHGCFKRICEVKPGAVSFLKDAARQFMRMGDYENAEDYINKYLDKSPENMEALNCLGNIYEEQKRYDKSLEVFKRVLDKDGENPVLQEAVSRVGAHVGKLQNESADVNALLTEVNGDESPEELQEKIRMYENSVGNIEKFVIPEEQKPDDNSVGQDIDSYDKIDFDELLKLEYKDNTDPDSESDYSKLIMEDSPVDFDSEEYDDRKESLKASELMPQDMPFEFNSGMPDDSGFNPLDYNYTPKYSPSEQSEVLDVNGSPFESEVFEEDTDLNEPRRDNYPNPYPVYPPPSQPQMPPQPSQTANPPFSQNYPPASDMRPERRGYQPSQSADLMNSGFEDDPDMMPAPEAAMQPEIQPDSGQVPQKDPNPQFEPEAPFEPENMSEPGFEAEPFSEPNVPEDDQPFFEEDVEPESVWQSEPEDEDQAPMEGSQEDPAFSSEPQSSQETEDEQPLLEEGVDPENALQAEPEVESDPDFAADEALESEPEPDLETGLEPGTEPDLETESDSDFEPADSGNGLLEAADALAPHKEPVVEPSSSIPEDGVSPEEKKAPPSQKDEKTTMNLVSDALQNAINAPVKKEFRDAADMFRTLRNLSSSLPDVQKEAFFNSLNKLKLDYVIERLSGKPGLLSAASAIRKTGGISGMDKPTKPSLLKTMTYMRTLINSLPDASQSWLLGKEVDKLINKAQK